MEQQILQEIEELRKLLHTTAEKYGIDSPETLLVSQRLDDKLNEYDRLRKQWNL